MKTFKTTMAFLTAMTMAAGAMGVTAYANDTVVEQSLSDGNTELGLVLNTKGTEMKQYLLDNGINETTADSTIELYLEGLKSRIERGIANADGSENNEKTAKYYKTMCMNVAKTEMYLADEKAEYSDNEAAEYFSENGIDGDDNLKMTTLFLDGCKKILMSIESLPENVNVTVDPTISYTNKIGDSSDLNALQEELAQYDKTLDADAYNDGKIVILDLTTDTSNNATLKGDADVNGEVGLSDVVAVSKHNINSTAYPLANETAEANADMNNDNVVDGLDTSALVEYNLGKK